MSTTSTSLLRQLRQSGAYDAWDRFVELYTPLIRRYALRAGVGTTDVDDVVQDVFLVLLRTMPEFQYDRRKSFRGWLHTITYNRCVDFMRRRRPEVQLSGDGLASHVQQPDHSESVIESEYRRYLIQRAFTLMEARLPPSTFRALYRHIVLDQPAEEVARDLGITVGKLYVTKCRVLRRLRDELSGLLDE